MDISSTGSLRSVESVLQLILAHAGPSSTTVPAVVSLPREVLKNLVSGFLSLPNRPVPAGYFWKSVEAQLQQPSQDPFIEIEITRSLFEWMSSNPTNFSILPGLFTIIHDRVIGVATASSLNLVQVGVLLLLQRGLFLLKNRLAAESILEWRGTNPTNFPILQRLFTIISDIVFRVAMASGLDSVQRGVILPLQGGLSSLENGLAAEPIAAEPIAAEPIAAEPMAAEPMAAEPMAAEPIAAEPMAAEPTKRKNKNTNNKRARSKDSENKNCKMAKVGSPAEKPTGGPTTRQMTANKKLMEQKNKDTKSDNRNGHILQSNQKNDTVPSVGSLINNVTASMSSSSGSGIENCRNNHFKNNIVPPQFFDKKGSSLL